MNPATAIPTAGMILAEGDILKEWMQSPSFFGVPIGTLILFCIAIYRLSRIERAIKNLKEPEYIREAPRVATVAPTPREPYQPSSLEITGKILLFIFLGLIVLVIIVSFLPSSKSTLSNPETPTDTPTQSPISAPTSEPTTTAPTSAPITSYLNPDLGRSTGDQAEQASSDTAKSETSGITPLLGYFSVGSSREHVIEVQGNPDSETENIMYYGTSSVILEDGYVKSWTDASKNLKAKFPGQN